MRETPPQSEDAMNEEELTKMPRQTARDILTAIPGGPGYEARVELALEVAMNTEWWRGYYAGRDNRDV
jgi:hypothetical protein